MEAKELVDAGADDAKGKPTKARRRTATKAQGDTGGKRSLNLRIDDETYERLHVHALRRRQTVSEVVMELARVNLREFYISRTPGGAARTEQDA